jgi:hypothetical protein
MRATGSNDCVFEDVFVSADFSFDWLNPELTWQHGPLANIPMTLQLGGLPPGSPVI